MDRIESQPKPEKFDVPNPNMNSVDLLKGHNIDIPKALPDASLQSLGLPKLDIVSQASGSKDITVTGDGNTQNGNDNSNNSNTDNSTHNGGNSLHVHLH